MHRFFSPLSVFTCALSPPFLSIINRILDKLLGVWYSLSTEEDVDELVEEEEEDVIFSGIAVVSLHFALNNV